MDHVTALNKLLANSCSNPDYPDDGKTRVFDFDLHCAKANVKAKHIGDLQYEILSVELLNDE